MRLFARLRAHASLWALVGLLGGLAVFVTSAVAPATQRIEDRALQRLIAQAPFRERDLTVTQEGLGNDAVSPEELSAAVDAWLPEVLRDAVETRWAYQRTTLATLRGIGATLTGPHVVAEPYHFAPVVTLYHQTDLLDEVEIDGAAPRSDPAAGEIQVLVAAEVAQTLGLRPGEVYTLHPGVVVNLPDAAPTPESLAVRVTGVFTPRDPTAPTWDHARRLLTTATTPIPRDNPPVSVHSATLVTDQAGFDLLAQRRLVPVLRPETSVRVRFDPRRVDAAWAAEAAAAMAALRTDPALRRMDLQTRLDDLLAGFERASAAAAAVVAVGGSGVVGVLGGLLLLAVRLAVERRREEVRLLRARGAASTTVAGTLAVEALWVVVPVTLAGWLLCRWLLSAPASSAVAAVVAGAVVLLTLPVAAAVTARSATLVRRAGAGRKGLLRVAGEVAVGALAVLGVVLLYQRGAEGAGDDPYLAAVPALLGATAGLVALRIYPWPLRALAAATARGAGLVSFLGLARAGRAAPAAPLALVVLVLSVALSGFAGALQAGIAGARDAAAVHAVGAHVRVSGEALPVGVVEAVRAVPGVTLVAPVSHDAMLLAESTASMPTQTVVMVDAGEFQRLLAELGVARRLPSEVLAATADVDPVPVLAEPGLADRSGLRLRVDGEDHPVTVVGDVAGLPSPDGDRGWVLVPRQAFPAHWVVDELLVAGEDVDPAAVAAAVTGAGEVEVTSVAAARAALEASGFNAGLTLVFVVGTVAGAAGAALAVVLAFILTAASRDRSLSALRTLGLSSRQSFALVLVEYAPLVGLAVLVGVTAGAAMPLLLGPALDLEEFAGGVAPVVGLAPGPVLLAVGLTAALLTAGAWWDTVRHRRRSLGSAMRAVSDLPD